MGRQFRIHDEPSPHVLRPYDRREVIDIASAAKLIGYSPATVRRLVAQYDLGRRIGGGNWKVSRVALRMFVEGDADALAAYHDGRRKGPVVRRYFEAVGIAA